MSEIILEELELQHFCSIEQATLPLEGRGLLLIQGKNEDDVSANSNGAGKSSIVDGLSWVLYGETARGISGDGVVNRTAGKGTFGQVKFRDGADHYAVKRHRKHKTGKNRLVLEQNGVDITKGTDKLTQDALEKILGCTIDVFVASIYAGQERMPNLPGMTDKELKTLTEEASGVKVLERAYEIARDRASLAGKRLVQVQGFFANAENAVQSAELEIENAKESEARWFVQRNDNINAEKAKMLGDVEAAKLTKAKIEEADVAALQANVETIKGQIAGVGSPPAAPLQPDAPEAPARPVLPDKPAPSPDIARLSRDAERAQDEIARLDRERVQLAHELKHLNEKVGTPCGECGKSYAEEDLEGRKSSIARRAREIIVLRQTQEAVVADANEKIATLADVDDRLLQTWTRVCAERNAEYDASAAAFRAEVQILRETHQQALDAHRATLARYDTRSLLASLTDAQNALQAVTTLQSELVARVDSAKRHRERIEALQAEENPFAPEVTRRHKALDAAILACDSQRAVLTEATAKADIATQAAEVFAPNGVRGEILDSVTPFLNDRTSAYLGALSDGNITAVWNTIGETGKGEIREKFHIAVDNKNGADSFEGLSGGERRKVRIATAMALQDLVASRAYKPIKLFVADEVDDALDVSGLERLMGILEDKARSVGTVLLVSHNDLADWCRTSVTMVKKGGVSTLHID